MSDSDKTLRISSETHELLLECLDYVEDIAQTYNVRFWRSLRKNKTGHRFSFNDVIYSLCSVLLDEKNQHDKDIEIAIRLVRVTKGKLE